MTAPEKIYLNLDLHIEPADSGYLVTLNGPAGQETGSFSLPFSDLELENYLLKLGHARRIMRRIDAPEVTAAKSLGSRLFDTVFTGNLRASLHKSLEEAGRQGAGLRLRLRLTNTPELADLPWEYLHHPVDNRFLALSAETPIVRYLELTDRISPLALPPPLRMLVMIASPRSYPPLEVEREWAKLQVAVQDLTGRGLLEVERIPATLTGLQRQLRRSTYHLVHFIGHGGFDERTQAGVLLLEDEEGESERVSGQELGMLLHDHRTLRFVMLNACEGARASRSDPFAGTAQSLVQQGIPAVMAMQFEVSDEAVITLAREFYSAVADSYPVDAALAEARKALFAAGNRVEWGTPVLYLRTPDGKIFDVARGVTGAPPASFEPAVERTVSTPTHGASDGTGLKAAPVALPALAGANGDRNRQRMLAKVRQFWIQGVLERSLERIARIDLALSYQLSAIDDPWQPMIGQQERPISPVAPNASIVELYDALEGALLILGAPGVGKTTILLELARTLITRAEQDPSRPIPVVFHLSSWGVRRRPIHQWLVDELSARYQVPLRLGKAWVEAGEVLPLFDGLDEVAPEHRNACVAALNEFRKAHWLLDFVVCSREADYTALTTRLQVQGAIVVQPLALAQVDAYLAQAGGQLDAVRALLRDDPSLKEIVDTPLMVSILAISAREMGLDTLRSQGLPAERLSLIFEAYLQRMLAKRVASAPYTPEQTMRWLGWLARQMVQRSQSIFFIEGLQPDTLPPFTAQWRYRTLVALVVGLLYGSVVVIPYEVGRRVTLRLVESPIAGLIAGLAAIGATVLLLHGSPSKWATWRSVARGVGLGLAAGTAVGSIIGFALAPAYGLLLGLSIGLYIGPQNGIAIGIALGLLPEPRAIESVETVRWSWQKALVELKARFAIVLAAASLIGLVPGAVAAAAVGPEFGMGAGMGLARDALVTMLLSLGLTTGELETRTTPNQGIRRSAWNALRVGTLFLLVIGLAAPLLFNVILGRDQLLPPALGLQSAAFPIGIIAGLVLGGYACLQHLVLRLLLWRTGAVPWNYARFLDHAAERLLLRKVGGGYIFVHRLLLEHIAARKTALPLDQSGRQLHEK